MAVIDPALRAINKWTLQDSADLYRINNWGAGFFRINEQGNVAVHPFRDERRIDLKELVDQIQARGIHVPILLRFNDILQARIEDIHKAFAGAMEEYQYQGGYSCIYPIKVNQQSHVVDEYIRHGSKYGFGIESGSKPELLAVLALTADSQMPIVCNGFKDDEYIESVIIAQKIGRKIIPVVEKFSELELIAKHAKLHDVRPQIGVRLKLASRGSGRWESSAGMQSKFGLTIPEVLRALEFLKERGMGDCLSLLHFHMGSQITNIRSIKGALTEAARVWAELYKAGAGMKYLDVGGGLGVDYDGSQTNFESSMNYSLQEYANDVVYRIKEVCEASGVPHPTIFSESGRALMAFHSLLVFNVLGCSSFDSLPLPKAVTDATPRMVRDLVEIHNSLTQKNYLEHYHDAAQLRDDAVSSFNYGQISLEHRGQAESLFWAICLKVLAIAGKLEHIPEELEGLSELVRDTYFCNFSVFQSMPDSWAIGQLFPVIPIHRMGEEPRRRAVLADITCDSDGKVDRFIDLHDVKSTLELHEFTGEPYYLGAFLIGAYQEILGDLHNLFGDTNAVHVCLDEDGEVVIDHVVEGDTVTEVLSYVQYNVPGLVDNMRRVVEKAVREKKITVEESAQFSRFYTNGMKGYTYLEESEPETPAPHRPNGNGHGGGNGAASAN
ncbi:MAG: biosynthetic arginine decarboxylase [Candidatus Sumerlaeia bacterium]|nr:biosynthetic arginine decarboxylase [Candidatus Sumerlaeia bacterium]